MALQSNAVIHLDGQTYSNFRNLVLHQQVNGHHRFEVTVRRDLLEQEEHSFFEHCQNLIGTPIDIVIEPADTSIQMSEGIFCGIITAVGGSKNSQDNAGDEIILRGYSPTILLDSGPHCAAFEETTLADIVTDATRQLETHVDQVVVNPVSRATLPYTVQYNESSFEFLRRLAVRHGEWFYYNGQQLVFGSNNTESVELKFGIDLKDFNMDMGMTPKTFQYSTRDYTTDELVEEPFESGTDLGGLNATMAQKSEDMYTANRRVDYNQFTGENGALQDLQEAVQRQKEATVSNMVKLTGCSTNPSLTVGKVISVKSQTLEEDFEYGQYIITSLTHTCMDAGNYKNHFEAVPLEVVIPPYTNVLAMPVCTSQTAKVAENNDPNGMGRVRVKFSWQTNSLSPWIRVSSPHSGGDKGMYFVPEVDEEVIVAFEGSNAEKPYVAGSLYHNNAKPESFTNENNDIKAIRTRSGHTVKFTDTNGEEKIEIFDNEGSIITFDTQAKSLMINSTENLELGAKNITISAEENITIGAQGNIEVAAEGDLSHLAQGNLALQSTGDTSVTSQGATAIEATQDASVKGMNLVAEGTQNADVIGGVQTNVTGTMTTVKGAAFQFDLK